MCLRKSRGKSQIAKRHEHGDYDPNGSFREHWSLKSSREMPHFSISISLSYHRTHNTVTTHQMVLGVWWSLFLEQSHFGNSQGAWLPSRQSAENTFAYGYLSVLLRRSNQRVLSQPWSMVWKPELAFSHSLTTPIAEWHADNMQMSLLALSWHPGQFQQRFCFLIGLKCIYQ